MKRFDHLNARSTANTIKILKQYGSKAKVIAGGTDLLGQLKDNILPDYPELIVNIKTIRGLNYIKENKRGLRIGALTKLSDIESSSQVGGTYRILADASKSVATPQIRRMGTIGGNLCQGVRCWYYRYPHRVGGRITCYLKGGGQCHALAGENQYHSIFGAWKRDDVPTACSQGCPAQVDIPFYLAKIRENDLKGAAKILLERNPFPAITGRICPHFCEQDCNRGGYDDPIAIKGVERYLGDYVLESSRDVIPLPDERTDKKVAIVGSGPAGLSAAYYLRLKGHHVTVFERMEKPGGMLTYGIPPFRLPKDIVSKVVGLLEQMGILLKTKVDVGKDFPFRKLKNDFDGIFIATGAWGKPSIGLDGEELTKPGLEFLNKVNLGTREVPAGKIMVIGGGNVAIDVAITARRLGSEEVTVACLESREEMPAFQWGIEQALQEGIRLMNSWGPSRVITSKAKVTGIELIRCTSVFDRDGRFAPTFDPGTTKKVPADHIFMAVGQSPDLHSLDPDLLLSVEGGMIVVDPKSQATDTPGIFAGGDVTSGPATVVEAIAAGRRAASKMDLFLKKGSLKDKPTEEFVRPSFLTFDPTFLRPTERAEAPKTPIAERGIDVEDDLGISLDEARTEASKCFNCGCLAVNASDLAVALLAMDAKLKILGPDERRIIKIDDFYSLLGTTLRPDEIITEIQVPKPPKYSRQTFIKFSLRKAVDFPIVSVASMIQIKNGICLDARIVLGAVAPRPIRAKVSEAILKGSSIDADLAQRAAEAAISEAFPLTKNQYKVQITKTLVKRAILSICEDGN